MSFDEEIKKAIPAEFHMISGSHDTQTSADVFDTDKFELPSSAGKAGGACTSALLQVLYGDHEEIAANLTWVQVLQQMREQLKRMGYDQIPQLTSSRLIDVNRTMKIVPTRCTGRRRAILIGINYVGQQGELSGCQNDVMNIKQYLENVQGFRESDMLILLDDDGQHHPPTRKNILEAFEKIADFSKEGDVVFVHYSGHGGRIRDRTGDEEDGYDETLIPVDFKESGQIVDDDLMKVLVKPMKKGVACTVLMDCCHSGTALDLPYCFGADESEMHRDDGFNPDRYKTASQEQPGGGGACCVVL